MNRCSFMETCVPQKRNRGPLSRARPPLPTSLRDAASSGRSPGSIFPPGNVRGAAFPPRVSRQHRPPAEPGRT